MSKSRPETFVGPWDVLDKYGADAFRWYMYTAAPPGEPRKFSVELVGDVVRNFYLTLWNVFSFFTTYANLDDFDIHAAAVPAADRDPLDRWILSELNLLVQMVTDALENYDAVNATRPIEGFVDDLSNWYLRRSRRRFWRADNDKDKLAAYQTLYECLVTVSKLLAPSMPFLADQIYMTLVAEVNESAPDSVHLAKWPEADTSIVDHELVEEMRLVKRLVSLGHSARNQAEIKVRQPLSEAAFSVPSTHDAEVVLSYQDIIKEELNVKTVTILAADAARMVDYQLKPIDTLGRKLRGDFPAVRQAIVEATPEQATEWAQTILNGEGITVTVNGSSFELDADEVIVQQTGAEGYAVSEDRGYLAALKTDLDDALINEGLAREVVRRIQNLRRDADLNISDHITVRYEASTKLAHAIQQYADYIAEETLADTLTNEAPNGMQASDTFDGETLTVGIQKV
jgi:isoleucyl-tRNA synthetase